MKNKRELYIIVAILCITTISNVFMIFKNLDSSNKKIIKDDKITTLYITSNKESSDKMYNTDIAYPIFDGLDTLNKEIENFVSTKIENFKKESKDNWLAISKTTPESERKEFPEKPFYMSIKWEPKEINKEYISIMIRSYAFVGGANGQQELKTFNFDISKNQNIKLSDLFNNDKNYLNKISQYSFDQLNSSLNINGDDVLMDMIKSGINPIESNFINFTRDGKTIEFYFQKYQVAPGYYGEQKVIYPIDNLSSISNPASENCTKQGGTTKISKDGKGGEYGLCYFDDNRACEEWAMLRGDCPIGGRKTTGYDTESQKYCAWIGGKTLAQPNAKCEFSDGSICDNEELFNGRCFKGNK